MIEAFLTFTVGAWGISWVAAALVLPNIPPEKKNNAIAGALVSANTIAAFWFFGVAFVTTIALGALGLLLGGKEVGQQLGLIGYLIAAILAWYHGIRTFTDSLDYFSKSKR